MIKLSGLGKGLESLIPKQVVSTGHQPTNENNSQNNPPKKRESVFLVETEKIRQNSQQPRRDFNEEELKSLSDSIREHGVLQPLIVTKMEKSVPSGTLVEYELIAGERRLRASKMAGLGLVPVIIREKTEDKHKLELALVENIQRSNLNSVEKARAYEKLAKEFGLSQKEIGERVGQSREAVANTLRLLQLPVDIQRMIQEGRITEGHGKALLTLENENQIRALLAEISNKNLSVRAAEALARQAKGVSRKITARTEDPETKRLESQLEEFLGTRVKLAKAGPRGRILIEFYSPEELNAILDKILKA
ncbi:hypothetical protein A2833_00700 [Candidatus Azambacteria bacterium RIFCSPHIGHO2_01_FULL_44_55]|uniref:ParB-like N-terminal domain-containing protein n=1 Tax=Candidatus Azambacteria bacterium RIFCSPLOWO2_02_FULL_44_14 TaxID=1797306 RepID=A0A1F5CB74_9BACT|nr:MAG: hypothetical protein A3C78_01630 [Candidatus Azambacteria bacterium RIFCSPHIGHO2_02_FULL_45_18]OGD40151.1 MAG: hypothetical protein A3I30_02685 [Candidatus Azambacteria bacterium RIFCSPLOWO2_02_FULL_44_14]OGD40888.1 MAG: hypothetical protein A2833_00700 [Candidatus Azambacteria bacterium RIFCSPHIGHO2_01_FULL_44_55]OGD49957.1 MAG: hypothetical protein A2608_01090 [Candidatus Azambacteria bacterium RIFOXYD1_FULL_44_10]